MALTLRIPGVLAALAAPLLLVGQAPEIEGPNLGVRAGTQDAWVEGTTARVRTRWTVVNSGKAAVEGAIRLPQGDHTATWHLVLGDRVLADPSPRQALPSLPPGGSLEVEILQVQRLRHREGRWHLELPAVPRLAPEAGPGDFRQEAHVRMPLPIQELTCASHSPAVTRLADGAFQVRVHPRDRSGVTRPLKLVLSLGTGNLEAGAVAMDEGRRMAVVVQGSRGPRVPREILWVVDPALLAGTEGRQAALVLLRSLLWHLEDGDEVVLALRREGQAVRLTAGPTGTGYQRLRRALETASTDGDLGGLIALAEGTPRRRGRARSLLLGVGPGTPVPVAGPIPREGQEPWVLHLGAAPAWARQPGWRSLPLEGAEAVTTQVLDTRRAPRLVDLRLVREGAPGTPLATAGMLPSHQPWVYEGPALAGPLQVEGWVGDAVHRWTLDPSDRRPGPSSQPWPATEGMFEEDRRSALAPPMPGEHVHGAAEEIHAPFLCAVKTTHEGLPPADLRARLEAVLLSPAHRQALRRTQSADFTVRLRVGASGAVQGVDIRPALRDRALQRRLERALKGVKLPGWEGPEGSLVELPVHAH